MSPDTGSFRLFRLVKVCRQLDLLGLIHGQLLGSTREAIPVMGHPAHFARREGPSLCRRGHEGRVVAFPTNSDIARRVGDATVSSIGRHHVAGIGFARDTIATTISADEAGYSQTRGACSRGGLAAPAPAGRICSVEFHVDAHEFVAERLWLPTVERGGARCQQSLN
jgi:hypothetical protein